MGAAGREGQEAKPGGWRQSLWKHVTDFRRLELSRGDIAIISISLLAMWSPIILIAIYVGAEAYGGSDVAFVVSMAIGLIGTITLYLKAFADMFGNMKMYEQLRKEFDEERKKNEQLRKEFDELRKIGAMDKKYDERHAEILRLLERNERGAGETGRSAAEGRSAG